MDHAESSLTDVGDFFVGSEGFAFPNLFQGAVKMDGSAGLFIGKGVGYVVNGIVAIGAGCGIKGDRFKFKIVPFLHHP